MTAGRRSRRRGAGIRGSRLLRGLALAVLAVAALYWASRQRQGRASRPRRAGASEGDSGSARSRLLERVERIHSLRSSRWVYSAVQLFVFTVLFRYFRMRLRGLEHLAAEEPAIIAAVHRSYLDGPIIGSLLERDRCRAMAKGPLFSNRVFAGLLASLGAFPVWAGGVDLRAMRVADRTLRAGGQLLIFPEGTRGSGPEVAGVFDGVGYLSAKTGAVIVPLGIAGTEAALGSGQRFPRRARIAVVAHPPIEPPPRG